MIGLLIIVVISWLLLRFTIQKNLLVLGLIPVSKRFLEFLLGIIIALGIHAFFIYLSSVLGLNKYTFKNDFQVILLFKSFIYHLRSALTEDLIFRGALLFLLMYKIGVKKALWLSALSFGFYHWFSYGIWHKDIIVYIYVLLITGFIGYVYGYGYAKSGSILLPLGLHLGWNFLATLCCDASPYGQLIMNMFEGDHFNSENLMTWFSLAKGFIPPILILILIRLKYGQEWLIEKKVKKATDLTRV